MSGNLLIFDLDGTLIDSKRDLTDSVNATRESRGLPALPDDIVSAYVGNGAPMLIRRALPHLNDEEHTEALQFFLHYYRDHMLDATTLYPGVREALDRLHKEKISMAILTNKPVKFSVRLIAGLGLSEHFFQIYGGNSFEHKKPHPIGILRLIGESSADPKKTVMVGDSSVDVMTARAAEVQACGVSWGFQPETFEKAPPDYVVDDLGELAARVLGK